MKIKLAFRSVMVLCSIICLTAFGFSGTAKAFSVGYTTDIFIDAKTDTIAAPLSEGVDEGTWRVAPNADKDAWNAWNGKVEGDPLDKGWRNDYWIGIDGTDIRGGDYTVYATQEEAYDALVALGPVYFNVPASVVEAKFWIRDTVYGDNLGGISLTLNKVPIPGAIWLLGSGLIFLVGVRRKFKS
jgi:hypothetical protein